MGTLRVGICWAGASYNLKNQHRSSHVTGWAPVFEVPGITLYSLQLAVSSAATDLRRAGRGSWRRTDGVDQDSSSHDAA
jgi:hypothetical protein